MQVEEFIEYLRANKNPDKIEGMENYMRNKFKFLGLQAAERRKLSREYLNPLAKKAKAGYSTEQPDRSVVDWDVLFTLWELPEREFQLTGIDYLKRVQQYLVLDDFEYLKQLVLTKSWWDTVDFLSKNIGAIVIKEPDLIETMKTWSLETNIWLRRVSILHQLSLKEKTNTKLLEEVILNNINDEEFFIQKAIGWALREYAKTDENWIINFIEQYQNQLSALSYREAIKNIK